MPSRPGWSRGAALRLALTLVVTALAFVFLWRVLGDVGLHRLGSRLGRMDPALVGAALALTVIRFVLQAWRWEVLARREAPVGLRQILPVLMAGNFLNLVTPALRVAGPILRAYYLSRETGRPRARFYGTIVADQTANFAVYAVAVALGAALVPMPGRSEASLGLGAALLAALIGGLVVCWLVLRRIRRGEPALLDRLLRGRGHRPRAWRARLADWWDHMAQATAQSALVGGAWWRAMGLSFLLFGSIVAAQVVSFAAIGASVPAGQAAFAVAGAGFIQVMAASPGGSGVTEASLIWVFMAMGLDGETAAAGVLLARCLNYAVLLPWGGLSFFLLQRRYGMPREAGAEA